MSIIPNLYIPGAAKSATSYLFSALGKSPDIFTPAIKEMHYMASEFIQFPLDIKDPFKSYEQYIIFDFDKYIDHYRDAIDFKYTLDCSPTYLFYPDSAKKIKSLSPNAKIIISLRNPVDRAFSQYKMNVRINFESLSFEEALENEIHGIRLNFFRATAYKAMGLYYNQLKSYYDAFGRENIKIILFEDIGSKPNEVILGICEFLNIEFSPEMVDNGKRNYTGFPRNSLINKIVYSKGLRKIVKAIIRNSGSREKLTDIYIRSNNKNISMSNQTRKMLVEYYADDIDKVRELTGHALLNWNS